MAFCTKCGKPLADGEICNCQANAQPVYQQPAQPVYQQPVQPQYQQPVQTVYVQAQPSAAGIFFKKLWNGITETILHPTQSAKKMVAEADIKFSMCYIGISSFLVGLYFLFYTLKIDDRSNGYADISIFPAFLLSMLISFGLSCAAPAFIMMFVKAFKGNTDYNKMLALSGVESIFVAPLALISMLSLVFFGDNTSLVVALVVASVIVFNGILAGTLIKQKLIGEIGGLDDEKSVLAIFFTTVIMIAITLIAVKLFAPICGDTAEAIIDTIL